MSVSIIRTSKGPLNLSAFCRTEIVQMDGKDKYIAFCMMDGGRLVLPLPEGDRLARWIEERSIFDSTVSGSPAMTASSTDMWAYERGSGGE